jgi:hypothetical protein
VGCMGMNRLISQSKTPTPMMTIMIVNADMVKKFR